LRVPALVGPVAAPLPERNVEAAICAMPAPLDLLMTAALRGGPGASDARSACGIAAPVQAPLAGTRRPPPRPDGVRKWQWQRRAASLHPAVPTTP
jgi:hypothetical protein